MAQRHADPIDHLALGLCVTVHRLTSAPGAEPVAVLPDGYIGFRCQTADVSRLRAWLARIGAGQAGACDRPCICLLCWLCARRPIDAERLRSPMIAGSLCSADGESHPAGSTKTGARGPA